MIWFDAYVFNMGEFSINGTGISADYLIVHINRPMILFSSNAMMVAS
jgi:hypothetical protein